MVMTGLTLKSLKHHVALIPLFACVGLGAVGSIGYLLRLALRNPEVSWAKTSKPEPWEDYRTSQYKFYSPNIDYSKLESPAPKY
ncbi:cytochrome c oxidase subunit NDUFA4 [Macrosteles quadrilineatus]|uniref:cytochrome c oxidase subunit NDUFA4 n=1 Tax=Macrosteles quadrilineatus TaxID=74068 RepID=UPI0023E149F6|nr:cytochrome c oxidase subunit NDUFA4 [Macrosteles quadrilineatus]